jgi:TP901 family phage tail tape measure protein
LYNEETEELDDGLKTISGDIADLTKTVSKPMGVTLFTDESHDTYRTTYEILRDIADIWDELKDKQRADLLQKLFGKTRAQAGAAILSNFDQAEKALITLQESAGSADREMGIIEQSWDFKINKFKETWTGFVQELIDRGTFGDLIDDLTSISETIQDLAKNIGLVGTAIAALGIYGGAHGAGPLNLALS